MRVPYSDRSVRPSVRVSVRPVRKKWLSPFFSTYWCYIHHTCTNCSSWHDLLIPRGGLCPWPTFHSWVTMVRKKWLSSYYRTGTYWCYIHQTCTNCSPWHDLLMPPGGLCPWPTFHAWVTMVRKKWLSLFYVAYECYIHQTYTNRSSWHDLQMPCGGLCPWPTFHASVTKRKRKRSDLVLWQKPLHQQKCQKGKVTTQTTPQKSSIKQWLRTDLGRSVGVATATQLVWLTGLRAHLPTNRNSRLIKRTHV